MSVPHSIIDRCDAVLTQGDADVPVITPFLPVAGLRHDENGKLSADSINTILDGMKSLGVVIDTDDKRYGVIQEAKYVLCKLNAQYEFMLNSLLSSISRSEKVDPDLISKLQTKNKNMQDVLSISRHVLEMDLNPVKEGFISSPSTHSNILEEFQTFTNTLQADSAQLKAEKYDDIRKHSIEISGDAARYASRFMEIFSFLNITAFGILLYIVSVN
uniref:Uncharacterized protein n=1 Tax=viral metagenome TaxID=1070528 RepID=A0A6C0DF00_9ZZZZ